MRKLFKTIANIWHIEDLRTRIFITMGFIAIYLLGTHIVLPGINQEGIKEAMESKTDDGLMSLLNMFTGGAFEKASIFALGIMPYISASIVMQLLGLAVPHFQKMQREGESGRRKMNQYTRYLTIIILLIQGPSYLATIQHWVPANALPSNLSEFYIVSTIIMAAGSMFVLWLGERITDKGIGNGISMIIMIGIIADLPQALTQEFVTHFKPGQGGLVAMLLEGIIWVAVIAAAIMLVQGVRRVPVQYAKRVIGNRQYGGARQYIPLKPYAANVMPIIFAQAIMFIPAALYGALADSSDSTAGALNDNRSFLYNVIFGTLIILFTYLYTAITMNPTQMAEDMKRNNGFIPGVKPGKQTAEFLDKIMSRITFPGALFIMLIAILPAFASLFGVGQGFARFFGGTSLLILVGVVLDTLQQIDSHLKMRHYEGLSDKVRIRGSH